MTSRERVTAALNHREPDRTPIFEYVLLSPVADALLGRRYAADPANWAAVVGDVGWEAAVRQNAIDRLDLAELLGHDMLYVTPNPLPPAPPAEPAPSPPAPTEDPVERVRRRNERAAQASATPHPDTRRVYVMLHEEMARRGIDLPILAPAWSHGVWTDVDLMQTMVLEPDVAHEHFAQATRRSLAAAEGYLALGIDLVGVGGDFAGNRPLISPEAYRTFIVPEIRKVTDRIHRGRDVRGGEVGSRQSAVGSEGEEGGGRGSGGGRRAWAVNASDGNLWSVIDDYLIGCGVDGYAEIDFHAGMDMGRLKAAYGDRITLFGNLDCGNVLSFGSPSDVRRHTFDCLEAGMGDGGHILCVSNAVTASVPVANYVSVVAAYRERFGLPALSLPPL